MIGAILVSHENLSRSILESLEKISGESKGIIPLSSSGLSASKLEEEIIAAIDSMREMDGVILFTDLYGGSCSQVCSRVQRKFPELPVITGFNLPLLIDFVFQREKPILEIVDRIIDRGRAGIMLHGRIEEENS
jgi:mannose/fructose-specific phosphotransferase system component IIA